MTVEELKALNLPVTASEKACLYVGAAVDWVNDHTTLVIDKDNLKDSVAALPDGAKLFLCRYYEVMSTDGNVTSESIGGMSQSFGTASKAAQLYQLASELMGKYLKGQISCVPNVSKWV